MRAVVTWTDHAVRVSPFSLPSLLHSLFFFKPFYKFMLFSRILQNLRIGGLESCLICNVMLFKP